MNNIEDCLKYKLQMASYQPKHEFACRSVCIYLQQWNITVCVCILEVVVEYTVTESLLILATYMVYVHTICEYGSSACHSLDIASIVLF